MSKKETWDSGTKGVTKINDAWFNESMIPQLNNLYADMTGTTGNNETHVIELLYDFAGQPSQPSGS